MMGYGYSVMTWMWPMMLIGTLIFLLVVGVIAYVLFRLVRNGDRRTSGSYEGAAAARVILDERYARGEIDEDEYRKRRQNLK